jgi:hypothetical protein
MPLYVKILIIFGSMVTLGLLSFIVYQQIQISHRQDSIEQNVIAQKQLVDGIVRSQASWTTKEDMDKFIKDNGVNLKAIQDDLSKLHADVVAANTISAHSNGQHQTDVPSTGTGPTNPNPPSPDKDPFGYQTRQQTLTLNEDFGTLKVPVGQVGFSAWKATPWDITINPREYNVTNVVGTDENRRLYFYNKFTVKTNDKTYEIPITTAQTVQEVPTAKFSLWNPRLFLGVDAGVNITQFKGEVTPNVSLGIMSYGQYKKQPDFSILEVGAGVGTISQKGQVSVTPFTYNIGKSIPLMNNLYIGPSLHIGFNGDISVMGGIRVGL